MQKVLERVSESLQSFIKQKDNIALIVKCPEAESILVLKILQTLDEASAAELFWIFPDDFTAPATYVSTLVANFAAKHNAARLAMKEKGMKVWPEMPPMLSSESRPPHLRLRELMAFARSLLPVPHGALVVWAMLPLKIQDSAGYARLMTETLQHEFPFPWCHHMRIFARDEAERPVLSKAFDGKPRMVHYAPDLSQQAMSRGLSEEAADEELPLERRLQSVLMMAGLDYAHQRYVPAMKKYQLLLTHYQAVRNHTLAALVLNGMGEVHLRIGDKAKAEAHFLSALTPATEGEVPPVPVLLNVLGNLANLKREQSQWAEAEAYYDGVEQLAGVASSPWLKLRAIENRGHCQYMQQKFEEALASWMAGVTLAKRVDDQEASMNMLQRLRQHCAKVKDPAKQRELERELAVLASSSTARAPEPQSGGVT